MKTLILFLSICFSITSFSAISQGVYYDNMDRLENLIQKKNWKSLFNENSIKELNKMTEDERFKLANYLQEEGVISKKLFFNAKNKIGLVQKNINSNQQSLKKTEIQKLSLFLISNIELR